MSGKTPGRAAYEAMHHSWMKRVGGDAQGFIAWSALDEPWAADYTGGLHREDMEAAAQAAIGAARVPSVIVNFDGEVTEERAAEIREAIERAMDVRGRSTRIRELRELIAEILSALGPRPIGISNPQIAKWRERAGLDAERRSAS